MRPNEYKQNRSVQYNKGRGRGKAPSDTATAAEPGSVAKDRAKGRGRGRGGGGRGGDGGGGKPSRRPKSSGPVPPPQQTPSGSAHGDGYITGEFADAAGDGPARNGEETDFDTLVADLSGTDGSASHFRFKGEEAPPSLLGLGTADPFSAGKAADARWADGDAGRRLDGGGLDLDGLAADLASIPLCDRLDVDGTRAIHGALHPNSVLRYAAEADAAARDISPVDSSEINTREPPQGGLGGTPGGIGSNTVVDSIMTTAGTRPPGLPAPAPAPGIETSESGTAGSGDDDDDGNLEDWLDSVLA